MSGQGAFGRSAGRRPDQAQSLFYCTDHFLERLGLLDLLRAGLEHEKPGRPLWPAVLVMAYSGCSAALR